MLQNTSIERITNFEKYYIFKDANITTLIFSLIKGKKYKETKVLSLLDSNYTQGEIENLISDNKSYYDVCFEKERSFALVNTIIDKINKKSHNNIKNMV